MRFRTYPVPRPQITPAESLAKSLAAWLPTLEPFLKALAEKTIEDMAQDGYAVVPKSDVVEIL